MTFEERLAAAESRLDSQRATIESLSRSIRNLAIGCVTLLFCVLILQATSCATTSRLNRIEGVSF